MDIVQKQKGCKKIPKIDPGGCAKVILGCARCLGGSLEAILGCVRVVPRQGAVLDSLLNFSGLSWARLASILHDFERIWASFWMLFWFYFCLKLFWDRFYQIRKVQVIFEKNQRSLKMVLDLATAFEIMKNLMFFSNLCGYVVRIFVAVVFLMVFG